MKRECAEMAEAEKRGFKLGGPRVCPKHCGECKPGHHWGDSYTTFAEEDVDHEAARSGVDMWYGCKHCDAWIDSEYFETIADEQQGLDHDEVERMLRTSWNSTRGDA